MKKIYQAGKTRIVSRFFLTKTTNSWIFKFGVISVEQIYDGRKWRFNRLITEDTVLSKKLERD